jgi:hypothetical protein
MQCRASSAPLRDLLDAPTASSLLRPVSQVYFVLVFVLYLYCGFDLCHKYILYLYLYFCDSVLRYTPC